MNRWVVRAFLASGISVFAIPRSDAVELSSLKQAIEKVVSSEEEKASRKEAEAKALAEAADTTGISSGLLDEILLSPEPYYYDGLGRRDPFASLVGDEAGAGSDDRLGANSLTLVGLLWGENDKYALVETADGRSIVFREGDSYSNATLTRINPDGIILYVNDYGVGRTLHMTLNERKGLKNDSRKSRRR